MDPLIVARWEFALTAGAHFLMVATTLGLAPLVAALQSALWRAGRPRCSRRRSIGCCGSI